jgi:hypothetical protein
VGAAPADQGREYVAFGRRPVCRPPFGSRRTRKLAYRNDNIAHAGELGAIGAKVAPRRQRTAKAPGFGRVDGEKCQGGPGGRCLRHAIENENTGYGCTEINRCLARGPDDHLRPEASQRARRNEGLVAHVFDRVVIGHCAGETRFRAMSVPDESR